MRDPGNEVAVHGPYIQFQDNSPRLDKLTVLPNLNEHEYVSSVTLPNRKLKNL